MSGILVPDREGKRTLPSVILRPPQLIAHGRNSGRVGLCSLTNNGYARIIGRRYHGLAVK
jgi:hypothetical protein